MKFKLGDFVRFVDEKREGYITRIIDSLTVGVTDMDGFEIPVAVNNLTTVYGHETHQQQLGLNNETQATVPDVFVEDGIFIAVAEVQKASSAVQFYLINHSSYQLLVSFTSERKGLYKGEFAGILPAHGQSLIYSAHLAEIDLWPLFKLQLLFYADANRKPKPPLSVDKKFRAKDFSGAKEKVELLDQYGWLIRIDEPRLLINPQKLKESFFSGERSSSEIGRPPEEIDLHIEALRTDHLQLNASEMLNIQLTYFEKMLAAAIVHECPKIVFIHGVGNGTLRHQIHKILSKHPQVRTFIDAQKQKFGFGATEVIFK